MQLTNQTAIITGASSGIGHATALRLAADGANVVLAARREERLRDLKEEIEAKGAGKALVVTTDVTSKADWDALVQRATDTFGPPDILVNNAGLMPLSMIKNLHTDEWERMVDVNIKGVMYGVAAVLPAMMERKSGHIVNIGSTASRRLFPGGAVYCATKFAVRAFSEGLRAELGPAFGIKVTNIEPGAVATELTDHITDEQLVQGMQKRFENVTRMEAEDIAAAIHYAVTQPERVNVEELLVLPTQQS